MRAHPTPSQLAAYVARSLSAQDLLRVDRHVAGCAECAAELSHFATLDAAGGLLGRVRRSGPHLTYEELEAVVDSSAPLSMLAERHLKGCGACRRELADVRGYAPTLSAKVDRREPARPLGARIAAWLGGPRTLGAATATVALAIAVAVVWQGGLIGGLDDNAVRSSHVGSGTAVAQGTYDESAFNELAAISPAADAAFRLQDFASVAKILQPLAAGDDARAQAALGLLYAEGRGVDRNPAEAERLLSLAAARDASAQHNLAALRQNNARSPTR
jgi:anti-sigma factor RsiW